MRPPVHAKYRADIDGLRAIAVLSVLGYHAFPGAVPGGFCGVDVFFVISGYLISSNILLDLAKDSFRFRTFYARRVKRIFPALMLVLAACLAAGWFCLLPAEYKQLGKHVAAGAGFVSNLVLWGESGYFDAWADLKPLLHLWSLGIEEQFYLAWPLLLYLAWKKQVRLAWAMSALIAASFLLNVYVTHVDVVAAFYSPITRFWELTMGSLLAYFTVFPANRFQLRLSGTWLAELGAAAGLLAIACAAVLLNTQRAFPGWWALLPTSGTILLIACGPKTSISRKILSNRGVVFIGLISYPLYLWHWPMLAFARILNFGLLSFRMRVAALCGSFLLAALTYLLVERPIRFGARGSAKVFVLASLICGLGSAGFLIYAKDGLAFRIPWLLHMRQSAGNDAGAAEPAKLAAAYASLNYDYKADARMGSCWLTPEDPEKFGPDCVDAETAGAKPKPLTVVWGDSHAGRLFPGVRAAFGEKFRLAEFARSSCPPLLDYDRGICGQNNALIMRKIREMRPEVAILFAFWPEERSWSALLGAENPKKLNVTIDELKQAGVARIIVIGPAPEWKAALPSNLVRIYQKDASHRMPLRTRDGLAPATERLDAVLAAYFAGRKDVFYVSALKVFCNEEGCLTRVNDEATGVTTWDYGHLTTAGATYLARALPMPQ